MHILAYIYGLAYYAVLSLTLMAPSTIRTAFSLVFRSPGHTAHSAPHPPSCNSASCLDDSSADYTYDGHVLEVYEIVLDPASAVSMVWSVFESVLDTLIQGKLILLVRPCTCTLPVHVLCSSAEGQHMMFFRGSHSGCFW